MARSFSSKQAKSLIDLHRKLEGLLVSASSMESVYAGEVKRVTDLMIEKACQDALRNIPVDELNRDKLGLRVGLLHAHGYHNVADVVHASFHDLEAIPGIGAESSFTIKELAQHIASEMKKGQKLRLTLDDQSSEPTRVIRTISQYKNLAPISADSRELLNTYRSTIASNIKDLEVATNPFKWFLTSSDKKARAIAAFNVLSELVNGSYGSRSQALINKVSRIEQLTVRDAWNDFSESPISFFNIIERINPGILGNDDSQYGLPAELAQEIQNETYALDGLSCELRRYQEWGVKYILRQKRVLLGDEMGLGKTIQAIAAMVALRNLGETHFIVICPAGVVENWCREIIKMSNLTARKVHGAGRQTALHTWLTDGGVAVTTYETCSHFELPEELNLAMLVVDEAHYIKNIAAKRTQNVRALCEYADRLLFMTGTALENRVDEMIALIEPLQPEIATKIWNMRLLTNAPMFRKEIAPVYYRRKRDDVLSELPDLIQTQAWCRLTPDEEDIYERAVLSNNFMEARRVSWNIDDLRNSSKAGLLMELINEAESEGRKILVFSYFLDTIYKLALFLGKRCLPPLTGSVSPNTRQEIIDTFETRPAGTVLLAQIQSGGTGLNIQSASMVIICEPQLKPSIESQAISRAYRMGQTRNVLVYRLLCEDTIDERLMSLLEEKQDLFNAFADQSVAADNTGDIDDRTFGGLIQEEIDRIKLKNSQAKESNKSL